MSHDSLKPLPVGLVRVSSERAPVRMRVLYDADGPQSLTAAETRLSSGPLPAACIVGYAVEPAIYRVRVRDDRPLEPTPEDAAGADAPPAPLRRAGPRAVSEA
jgi:hypothetical protein